MSQDYNHPLKEDVVQSSMSELIFLLLFFFLILLGSFVSKDSSGGDFGTAKIAELRRALNTLEAENTKLRGQVYTLEGQLHGARQAYNDSLVQKQDLEKDIAKTREENRRLETGIADLKANFKKSKELVKTIQWPPSLPLPDNQGYRFELSKSIPKPEFETVFLNVGLPSILQILEDHQGAIHLIEVIGHTDETVHGSGKPSDLDQKLIDFVHEAGKARMTEIKPLASADNAGLGLARAATIASVIKHKIKDRFPNIIVLPYSAAQLILPNNTLALPSNGDKRQSNRRRIEIRFRGKNQ